MNEKVLVVMPCYNVENTLYEALESVKCQTYSNYVLVCCDDKSTDSTLSLLQKYQSVYNYILLSNDVNLGTGHTVNRCIREYLMDNDYDYGTWVSSDNILESTFIEDHVNKLNEGYAITYSGWASFGRGSTTIYPTENLLHLKNSYQLGPCFMFRKKLFDIAGPYHKLPGEDFYFAVKCALVNAKFGYIPKVLVKYRDHENSVSGRLNAGLIEKKLATPFAYANSNYIKNNNGTDIFEKVNINFSKTTFVFNANTYNYAYNSHDLSGLGCITEIVTNNEYKLDLFNNLSDSIIDIGGNSGVATIILARQNPNAIIYTFEPDYNLYLNIIENVKINNLKNVIVFNVALSNNCYGTCELSIFPGMTGANTIYANDNFNEYSRKSKITYIVPTTTLDAFIYEYNVTNINVMKIDCEGAEYDILYESSEFKKNIIKNMIGEFHNLKYTNTKNNGLELLNYCKEYINGILQISILNFM